MTSNTAARKPGTGKDRWTDEHTKILVRGIIVKIMSSRKDLYLLDGIVGCVDNHGNDRTSKKVAQILETLATAFNLEKGAVGKAKSASAGTKRKAGGTGPKAAAKKRRGGSKTETETETEVPETDEEEAEFTE